MRRVDDGMNLCMHFHPFICMSQGKLDPRLRMSLNGRLLSQELRKEFKKPGHIGQERRRRRKNISRAGLF